MTDDTMLLFELSQSDAVAHVDDDGRVWKRAEGSPELVDAGRQERGMLPMILFAAVPVPLHLRSGLTVAPLSKADDATGPRAELEEQHREPVEPDHHDGLSLSEVLARFAAAPDSEVDFDYAVTRALGLECQLDELWVCAIGEADHDPRCEGDCGPCGGDGGVPDNPAMGCLTCGGNGECQGCSVGYLLKAARRELEREREAARLVDEQFGQLVTLHDGVSTAWVCDQCGQPIGRDGVCNSGIHVGPGEEANGRPVASTDVVASGHERARRINDALAALNADGPHFDRVGRARDVLAGGGV